MRNFALFLLAVFLCACAANKPAAPVPDAPVVWQQQAKGADAAHTIPGKWWLYFEDPALDQLIEKAVKKNPDQRLALARITEARAIAKNNAAQSFPVINGVASAERNHVPTNGNSFRSGTNDQFAAGFDAGWEIDLFGRNRQRTQAARAEAEAVTADSRATTLSLIAEMARQYTLHRLYQAQAALAGNNAEAQEGVLKITEARFNEGIEGDLELMRSRALLETTRAQIPLYQNLAQTAAYQIDYLAGEKPGGTLALLENKKDIPVIKRDVFLDVPLTVLQQRPDIAAAAQRVIAATSLKSAAMADLYPTVSVSALLGLSASGAGDLFNGDSKNWSAGGSLLAPLFDFGRIRSNINAAKAREEQAIIRYEQTLLAALRDVESAASSYKKAAERYAALDKAMNSSQQAVVIARKQYQEGILSHLDILSAEQTAYSAQEATAQAAAELTQNFVALCKALALLPAP